MPSSILGGQIFVLKKQPLVYHAGRIRHNRSHLMSFIRTAFDRKSRGFKCFEYFYLRGQFDLIGRLAYRAFRSTRTPRLRGHATFRSQAHAFRRQASPPESSR
jgi:hypothetical protein